MELKNLRTLLTVADQGSYQKAADTLGYTQSTVTVHIQQLERAPLPAHGPADGWWN